MDKRMKTINTKKALLISLLTFNSIFLASCSETTATVAEETKKEFAIPVSVTSIERNNISSNFHTTATLESRTEADIITRVTGIIEQLSVEEGDYVEKGQVLAEIDPRRYQLALDKADAELGGINQELQRLSLMAEKKLVSAQASDKLKYQHQAAIAARKLAVLDLQDSQVVAPISGFISHRYVKAGYFTQGYQKLFHIVDSTNLQAVVYLPEHQLNNVKLDQQANLSFSARQNQLYQAKVRSISPVIDPNSGTFKVILSIANNEQELKPGMFAQIALTFATHLDAFTIPSDAIITLDNSSKIYLVRENKAIEVPVSKGFIEEQLTEITGDIKEGDLVVINGQHNLKAEALVEVLNLKTTSDKDDALITNETAIVKAH